MITERLIQARSLSDMASSRGKRIANLPFYCESEDGESLIFHILTGETNAAWLRNMINAGRIYLRKNTVIINN